MINRLNPLLDWVDARLPVVTPTRHFMDHPVQRFSNILDLMGELTLFMFVNQVITGILLSTASSSLWNRFPRAG